MLFVFNSIRPTVRDLIGSIVNLIGGDAWYNVTVVNDTNTLQKQIITYLECLMELILDKKPRIIDGLEKAL